MRSRIVNLGASFSTFMRSLGLAVTGGKRGTIGAVREQSLRISQCSFTMQWSADTSAGHQTVIANTRIVDRLELWSSDRQGWVSSITNTHNHTESRAMNTAALVEKIAEAAGMPKATASRAVEAVVQTIIDALQAGEEVRLTGLGIFGVATREARPGRNPQTGESINIPASKALRFSCGKSGQRPIESLRNGKIGANGGHRMRILPQIESQTKN
jgi:DNA-binding protein HU-beta